jgi:hypothetical protein
MDQTAHYITVLYIRGSFRNAEEAAFLFTVVRRSAIIMTAWVADLLPYGGEKLRHGFNTDYEQ